MPPERDARAEAAVEGLFARQPLNAGEIKARFHGLPRDAVTRALIDRLERGAVAGDDSTLFAIALKAVGPGRLKPRLAQLALDRTRPVAVRVVAHAALVLVDRRQAERVAERLDPETRVALAQSALETLGRHLLDQDEPGRALADVLRDDAPGGARPAATPVILVLERERRRAGVTGAEPYGPALVAGLLGEHEERLVSALEAGATEEAAGVLERLAEVSAAGLGRRHARAAALRVRTELAGRRPRPDPREALSGRAWVSACDGQGSANVFVLLEGGSGATGAGALCLRLDADVRDGLWERGAGPLVAEKMRARFEEVVPCVAVPLATACRLVHEAGERTRALGRRVPKNARRLATILERVRAELLPPWPASPDPGASLERARGLLEERHRSTWYFTQGDVEDAGSPQPWEASDSDDGKARDPWIAAAARALDAGLRTRLLEMARHEARVCAWQGARHEAAIFTAFAQEIERGGLGASALAHAMLERSWTLAWAAAHSVEGRDDAGIDGDDADDDDPGTESELELELHHGDPDLRRLLRAELFGDVEEARGRDLARLDLAEVIEGALVHARAVGALRLDARSEDVRRAAGRLSDRVVDVILAGRSAPGAPHLHDAVRSVMAPILRRELGVDPSEARAAALIPALHGVAFVSSTCSRCPVRCLDRPDEAMGVELFSDEHPAGPGSRSPRSA